MVIGVSSLLEVIAHLSDFPTGGRVSRGSTIYARKPWTPAADAVVLEGDDGVVSGSGHDYLLEVDLVFDVLDVWSDWRGDVTPSAEEAALAVIYYAEHDAYQPTDLRR